MAINYPGSLDDFTNPAAGNTLDSPSHSGQHSDLNDAVEALEAKVGIGASPAGSATAGQVLTAQGGGTAIWETPTDTSGLVHINTTTISASSSESFDNVFTATYDNYKIYFVGTGSTNIAVNLRLRASGTDNSTASSYVASRLTVDGTTLTGSRTTSNLIRIGTCQTTLVQSFILDINNPFLASATSFNGSEINASSNASQGFNAGTHNQTVSYDGFTLLPNTGNISGLISIFAYRKA